MQAWKNQFEKPTLKSLSEGLSPEARARHEKLSRALTEKLGKKGKLAWLGASWGWCEGYTGAQGGLLVAVHVIPDPGQLRVAMTVGTAFFEQHRFASLPKSLHSGLGVATCVGHQTWCEWMLSSDDVLDGVLELVELANG